MPDAASLPAPASRHALALLRPRGDELIAEVSEPVMFRLGRAMTACTAHVVYGTSHRHERVSGPARAPPDAPRRRPDDLAPSPPPLGAGLPQALGQLFEGKQRVSLDDVKNPIFWVDTVKDLVLAVLGFIPRIIVAGLFLARILAGLVGSSTGEAGYAQTIVKYAIIALFTAIGLTFMGLADQIVMMAFGLILGSAAVATALGLGRRTADAVTASTKDKIRVATTAQMHVALRSSGENQ